MVAYDGEKCFDCVEEEDWRMLVLDGNLNSKCDKTRLEPEGIAISNVPNFSYKFLAWSG